MGRNWRKKTRNDGSAQCPVYKVDNSIGNVLGYHPPSGVGHSRPIPPSSPDSPVIPRDSAASTPSGSKQARRARGNTLEKETGNLIKRSNNGLCTGNQEAIELPAITEQWQRAEVLGDQRRAGKGTDKGEREERLGRGLLTLTAAE